MGRRPLRSPHGFHLPTASASGSRVAAALIAACPDEDLRVLFRQLCDHEWGEVDVEDETGRLLPESPPAARAATPRTQGVGERARRPPDPAPYRYQRCWACEPFEGQAPPQRRCEAMLILSYLEVAMDDKEQEVGEVEEAP